MGDDASIQTVLRRKLADPHMQTTMVQSIAMLLECTCAALSTIDQVRGRHACFIIGASGAGKSTLANIACGCQVEWDDNDRIIVRRDSTVPEQVKIGQTAVSETFIPNPVLTKQGLVLVDCPGFHDNRGPEINIANAVNTKQLIQVAASVRFLLCVNGQKLLADRRGDQRRALLKELRGIFESVDHVLENVEAIAIVVSQVPPKQHKVSGREVDIELDDIRQIFEDTKGLSEEEAALVCALASRLCMYHPLDQGNSTWLTCEGLIQGLHQDDKPSIRGVERLRTLLTPEDKEALRTFVDQFESQIDEAWKTGDHRKAGELVRTLEALEVVGSEFTAGLIEKQHSLMKKRVQDQSEVAKGKARECKFQVANEEVAKLEEIVNNLMNSCPGVFGVSSSSSSPSSSAAALAPASISAEATDEEKGEEEQGEGRALVTSTRKFVASEKGNYDKRQREERAAREAETQRRARQIAAEAHDSRYSRFLGMRILKII